VTAGNQEVDKFGSEGGGGLILAAQVAVDQDSGSVGGSVLGLLGFQCGRWGFFSVQRTVLFLTRFWAHLVSGFRNPVGHDLRNGVGFPILISFVP